MKKITFRKGMSVASELCAWAHLDGSLFLGIPNSRLLTDQDFEIFRSWGLDHMRVMIDFSVLMETAPPYGWKENAWQILADTIRMAEKHEIGLVLDLHSTLGSEFQEGGSSGGVRNELLSNPEQQEVFYRIWREFSIRCAGTEDFVAFEILNEVTFDGGIGWNTLALNTIKLIRSYSADRRIVLGGTGWNSIGGMTALPVLNDENIIYTFHFYQPHTFTHQILEHDLLQAIEHGAGGGLRIPYPGKDPASLQSAEPPRYFDKTVLKECLAPLYEFRKAHPYLQIYCGEFGVNQYVHGKSRLNWQRDVLEILKENNVNICYFMYKWPAWGIMDAYNATIYDKPLIELLKQY